MKQQYQQYLLDGRNAGIRYGLNIPRSSYIDPSGSHLGMRSGSSLEFVDHREYVPGDDLRRVDWNAYARSDRLAIKTYRSEVYPYVDIILDCSRSMSLEMTPKAQAALGLAALFAQAAGNCGYMFKAWAAGQTCEKIENGNADPMWWEGINFDYRDSLTRALRYMPAFRPRSIRLLISDLLWLGEPMEMLAALCHQASAVYVVQVLTRTEIEPAEVGNLRLVDFETDQSVDVFVDEVALGRYKDALSHHQQNWSRAAIQVGAVLTTLVAEQIVGNWQLDDLVARGMLKAI